MRVFICLDKNSSHGRIQFNKGWNEIPMDILKSHGKEAAMYPPAAILSHIDEGYDKIALADIPDGKEIYFCGEGLTSSRFNIEEIRSLWSPPEKKDKKKKEKRNRTVSELRDSLAWMESLGVRLDCYRGDDSGEETRFYNPAYSAAVVHDDPEAAGWLEERLGSRAVASREGKGELNPKEIDRGFRIALSE